MPIFGFSKNAHGMKLQTPVQTEPLTEGFTYKDRILFIGSCFAENIGNLCSSNYMHTMVNPMGILFNPCSIADCLGIIDGYGINPYGCSFTEADAIQTPAGYCSFHHHGSFARPTAAEFVQNANAELAKASEFVQQARWVVVTLGTAFVYRTEDGMPVSNCHKLPGSMFTRTMLTPEQAADAIEQYIGADPERQWILTVSPVRHMTDGMHQNQLSKATLLMAVEILKSRYPNVHYFPSYEIMLDELRDYRFYAEDMAHPSAQATQYIWERFMEFGLQPDQRQILQRAQHIRQQMEHRILNPGTEQASAFIRHRQEALEQFLAEIE